MGYTTLLTALETFYREMIPLVRLRSLVSALSLEERQTVSRTANIPAAKDTIFREILALPARCYILQEDRFKKLIPHEDRDSDVRYDLGSTSIMPSTSNWNYN